MSDECKTISVGDVVQITENYDRGFVGAFLLVEEVRRWGVIGFIAHVKDRLTQGQVHLRLKYDCVERIGKAKIVPEDFEIEST